jgi:Ca-activated chloride channel family protein
VSLVEHLAWPEALPVLLLAPLVGLLLWALDRARARRLRFAVGPRSTALAVELSPGRRRLRRTLFTAALLLALFAALQPLVGEGVRRSERRGVDMVICLGGSRSMLARDVEPSRLARAHREVRALAEHAVGDRMGLVTFAGEARRAVPLTRDLTSFAELAARADPLSVARGGTDLGAALRTALDTLVGRTGEHEVVLLLTDGDDHEGRGLAAAAECRQRGITVHCVGLGSARGAKIPVETESGEAFLTDRAGRDVVSALDVAGLTSLAERTGGEFVSAGDPDSLLGLYEERILPMARTSLEAEDRRERENRFQWPLLAAFVLWILELCVCERRR